MLSSGGLGGNLQNYVCVYVGRLEQKLWTLKHINVYSTETNHYSLDMYCIQ